jgi:CheY-like chemotaxis protein
MNKKKDSKRSVPQKVGKARSICNAGPTVLHIDDDPNDAELLEAAICKAEGGFILRTVPDGEQAMAYLNGQGMYADRTRFRIPSLVLLDLKMPRATGLEVLKWIRGHPLFGGVPVMILSGSELKADIDAAYDAGANSYKIKPLGFSELVSLVRDLKRDWLTDRAVPPSSTGQRQRLRAQDHA